MPSSVSGSAGWSRVSPQGVVHGASRVDRRGRLGELEPDTFHPGTSRCSGAGSSWATIRPSTPSRVVRGSTRGHVQREVQIRRIDVCFPRTGPAELSMR